ncbi:MAG: hypothetical protein GF384_05655 [Elusimicrobia bacterium]|nr:hypothetical protein [Elusimicrobiota bacterium]
MIYSITGIIELKETNRIVLNAQGVGYEIMIPTAVFEALPDSGEEVKLLIIESTGMYGGGTTLYGFLTHEQKNIYTAIKEFVPSTGAKKALDYLDKASKSLPDFRRAIIENDPYPLVGIFGFSKKAAQKILAGLKDRLDRIPLSGTEKWQSHSAGGPHKEAVAALMTLGFKQRHAEELIADIDVSLPVSEIIKRALKKADHSKSA